MATKAFLVLEDGAVYEGVALGAEGETAGELVFNTAHAGYQEILTDPSYRRQIICMAFPAMGNYSFMDSAAESDQVHAAGFVVADSAAVTSMGAGSGPGHESLDDFLRSHNVVGINGIDTRAVVRHIRNRGAMRAVISSRATNPASLVDAAKLLAAMEGADLVMDLADRMIRTVLNPNGKIPVGLLDCGAKRGIVDSLIARDCRVSVFPATASADDILAEHPAGVVLSNGPGDPAALPAIVCEVRKLIGKVPIFGICLGHQMLALASGARTYKLPFGHRGANHPVLDLISRSISITSQNHGFAVDESSLPESVMPTERNLYDGTNEGLEVKGARAFSVQYHPEARPGPLESGERFDRFLKMVL